MRKFAYIIILSLLASCKDGAKPTPEEARIKQANSRAATMFINRIRQKDYKAALALNCYDGYPGVFKPVAKQALKEKIRRFGYLFDSLGIEPRWCQTAYKLPYKSGPDSILCRNYYVFLKKSRFSDTAFCAEMCFVFDNRDSLIMDFNILPTKTCMDKYKDKFFYSNPL